jgi:hypothetical protein
MQGPAPNSTIAQPRADACSLPHTTRGPGLLYCADTEIDMDTRYRVVAWTDSGSSALFCGLDYHKAHEQAQVLRDSGFRNVQIYPESPSLAHVRAPIRSRFETDENPNTEE